MDDEQFAKMMAGFGMGGMPGMGGAQNDQPSPEEMKQAEMLM